RVADEEVVRPLAQRQVDERGVLAAHGEHVRDDAADRPPRTRFPPLQEREHLAGPGAEALLRPPQPFAPPHPAPHAPPPGRPPRPAGGRRPAPPPAGLGPGGPPPRAGPPTPPAPRPAAPAPPRPRRSAPATPGRARPGAPTPARSAGEAARARG